MQTIMQESSSKFVSAPEPKLREVDMDLDHYWMTGFESLTTTYPSSSSSSSKGRHSDEYIIEEEPDTRRGVSSQFASAPQPSPQPISNKYSSRNYNNSSNITTSDSGEAQKKFGSAKAISSDQYFRDSADSNSVSGEMMLTNVILN